ncbi:MAG: UDP-N-acetylmuramoyl-L-alanyl-D-glutamate--2,6-diaminopimelate ligase [Actinobacteria bacterium]|nr:UDP-N-acetylmuramoyl-L-alanyl-D-glutamate--2,6-diaminopimelate ligase [Actinomycetota bacterium]MCA1720539.1 UDP-N-acetylmuramoyl-L-alanyl-D-glutamate--2,6-diaminopimelate ligase [Actinomycetota bacterium]
METVPGLRLAGSADVLVSGCTHDSRTVEPGDLYAALPGARAHGADFADAVRAAGAAAVLTDAAGADRFAGLPVLVAEDPRGVLGEVARWVHGSPADDLLLLGVTGTNGKTTTAFLLEAGLRAAGHSTALLGTVLTRIGDEVLPSVRTTPEATDLQAMFAVMRERGVTAVAMEVSSHALALGRVDGVVFDVAAFTNLSQDHLDFHGSMAEYEAAKAQLFTPRRARRGVVNCDDPAGRRIVQGAQIPLSTYGEDADWTARKVDLRPDGSSFRLVGLDAELGAQVRLPGAFNVANAVCALATLAAAGVDLQAAACGIADLPGVPGRMERVDAGQPFLAVVDYAHTPEAVTTLLSTVRALTSGRVIAVLGCGGDRDRAKRPLMGRAVAEGADVAVLTSDNPRSEDPRAILAEMAAGAPDATVEPDRRAAIALAVRIAGPGDAVVVAGKGHESGQEADGVVTPFDDRLVLREAVLSCSR